MRFRWIVANARVAGFGGDGLRASLIEDDINRAAQVMITTDEIAEKIAAEQNVSGAQAKAIVESVFKQPRQLKTR